ncbi:hypothetical protein GNE08_28260 (plasmid) [Trichormus variabilis ARAD]|nr:MULTISPECIES: hypothetical protein [Nostocaceae]MBC1218084.1 hypothetical protein [Trichormus variabilis ARAD]MBC1259337.1 hypothetical protein [Trichormus variabilis V5]MBC1270873.1 hypothetical protein [Trichormus variabilis FSR]MBC1305736.1 hypothetical protein [Trichormus variabilis N2B]MBC1314818.1 hypothetical protein [Trichormus variabilis PNB]
MVFLALIITICFIAAIVSKLGISPYIASAATISLSISLHLPLNKVIILCVAAYCTSYWVYSAFEVAGLSIDLQTTLAGVEINPSRSMVLIAMLLRMGIFFLFMLLPIGKPTIYIEGFLLVILVIVLVISISNNLTADLLTVLIQAVLFGICFFIADRFAFDANLTPALLASMGVCRLLMSDVGKGEILSPVLIAPGLIRCGFILVLTWITPGFSFSLISNSLLPATYTRSIWLAALSAGVEGWALRICLSGETTGKTMLSWLLVQQLGTGRYPFDSAMIISIWLVVILSMIIALVMLNIPAWLKPAREIGIFLLVLQGALVSGGWVILFIIVGCLMQLIRLTFGGKQEVLATGFLIPILIQRFF